ncbi:CCC motif membrane protein [Mariniflexile litorale]|uniref:CCC motif membrane protein n=1 Tax=Mariniflexile litorale TaxID=3045158 RepID=A0AAU7EFE5_9FLAO|nr:CCC motif membrane protein [Mariniflexile sp. KMM 9835]MDQ8213126.1 CCC motif membrane protein [Mariniflexile sp. KMM 9835]
MEIQKLNPTIVYVLAILGLLCCCFGGLGFILAGIAFIMANSKLNAVKANPENYDPASVKSMNTAKIIALVILIINILYLVKTIYTISTVGWDAIMEQSQTIIEQWQNK